MSKTISPRIRQARLRLAKSSLRRARAAFQAGDRRGTRHAYLEAGGWFRKAGAEHLARHAEAIGLKVIAFQRALGEHVGPARRFPIGTSSMGRMVSLKGR